MSVTEALSATMLVLGAALALIAGVGLLRLPDVFARMHAATKPATLGLVLLAVGAGLAWRSVTESITLALVVVLQFLTAPAGSHMVGRAVARAGVARDTLQIDDLPRFPDRSGDPGPGNDEQHDTNPR